jgi:hypothetical protein
VIFYLSQEVKELRQEVRQLGQLSQKSRNLVPPLTASDRMIQGAIWVIIATAIVSVVSNVSAVILKVLLVNPFRWKVGGAHPTGFLGFYRAWFREAM